MNTSNRKRSRVCQICGEDRSTRLNPATFVRSAVSELIRRETGNWLEDGWICSDDLQKYRQKYVEELLRTEKGELTELDREVIESLRTQDILARNPDDEFQADLTVGQKVADYFAIIGGSWTFILMFTLVIFVWVFVNSVFLIARPFDPYPYILLNLMLSCLAAIQAPIIMMSQKRQETRDRMRAMHDYQINLKAELEIRHLHQKIDHMLTRQWERLVEIQEIQMELMSEKRDKR